MKHLLITLAWMAGWVAIALAFSGCVSTVTKVTSPDGTVTETRITAADGETIRKVADAAIVVSSRAIIVEK